ncbi:hypothetical protein JOH51_006478 [Rhizobium leguminosarum]|nr:hypothetical protein [Rhizobium leguminosarum]
MTLSEHVKPISYLKAHAAGNIRSLKDKPQLVAITLHREAKDPAGCRSIRKTEETQPLLKVPAFTNRQVEAGKHHPAAKSFATPRTSGRQPILMSAGPHERGSKDHSAAFQLRHRKQRVRAYRR